MGEEVRWTAARKVVRVYVDTVVGGGSLMVCKIVSCEMKLKHGGLL